MDRMYRNQHMFSTLKHFKHNHWWSVYKRKGGGYDTAKQIGPYKVETQNDDPYIDILIWNPDNKPCVHMAINTNDKLAVLNSVTYYPKCRTDGYMIRGEGTKQMIQFAFDLAKTYGVERVELMDKSTTDCNGQLIDLAVYSMFKYGKTWYERHFQFRPGDEYSAEFEKFRNTLPRIDKTCQYFTTERIQQLSRTYRLDFLKLIRWEKVL